jgi:general secretion pathway protein J
MASSLRRPVNTTSGFTLLELLVAIAIFAVIGAMALGGLNAVVTQQTRAQEQMARLSSLQRAMRLLVNDLGGLQPRFVRDELGTQMERPLISERSGEFAVRLTRGGWSNPVGLNHRGTLQRVQYRVDDDVLLREYWPVTDHLLGQEPRRQELLTGVESFELAYFLDQETGWQPQWPPLRRSAGNDPVRPRAVRVRLRLDDYGDIERVVELPQ